MSIIGLDFGSHSATVCLWYEDKDTVEVIANDLGSRVIPCSVAFREGEILMGESASSQKHKNMPNTFDDIRGLLLNPQIESVNIPDLEKTISVEELGSYFFQNIHNQVKQYVNKPVYDCIVSIPANVTQEAKLKIIESAKTGNIHIKSFIDDSSSTLLAHEVDTIVKFSNIVVVDLGWSKTEISVWSCHNGAFSLVSRSASDTINGEKCVKALSDYCATDFQKKTKLSCLNNNRAMMRLSRECESVLKTLSTVGETTLDIDSLFEGMDYSTKISRARFEDITTVLFSSLKSAILETFKTTNISLDSIDSVLVSGGLGAVPKVSAVLKDIFPKSNFSKSHVDPLEAMSIGAALWGKHLVQRNSLHRGLSLDMLSASCLGQDIIISSPAGNFYHVVLKTSTLLPCSDSVIAEARNGKNYFQVALDNLGSNYNVCDVVFDSTKDSSNVKIEIKVSIEGDMVITVTNMDDMHVITTTTVTSTK